MLARNLRASIAAKTLRCSTRAVLARSAAAADAVVHCYRHGGACNRRQRRVGGRCAATWRPRVRQPSGARRAPLAGRGREPPTRSILTATATIRSAGVRAAKLAGKARVGGRVPRLTTSGTRPKSSRARRLPRTRTSRDRPQRTRAAARAVSAPTTASQCREMHTARSRNCSIVLAPTCAECVSKRRWSLDLTLKREPHDMATTSSSPAAPDYLARTAGPELPASRAQGYRARTACRFKRRLNHVATNPNSGSARADIGSNRPWRPC